MARTIDITLTEVRISFARCVLAGELKFAPARSPETHRNPLILLRSEAEAPRGINPAPQRLWVSDIGDDPQGRSR
jgi:hypothetical protein